MTCVMRAGMWLQWGEIVLQCCTRTIDGMRLCAMLSKGGFAALLEVNSLKKGQDHLVLSNQDCALPQCTQQVWPQLSSDHCPLHRCILSLIAVKSKEYTSQWFATARICKIEVLHELLTGKKFPIRWCVVCMMWLKGKMEPARCCLTAQKLQDA